jgi:hypothetical protein
MLFSPFMQGIAMVFQKKLWAYSFVADRGPNYPCPHCKSGSLKLRKGSIQRVGPYHAKSSKLADSAFTGMLDCSACEGSVVVVGYVRKDDALVPKGIYPAPPIIRMPAAVPRAVLTELDLAFALFWVDLSSCANKIRISLERLLDALEVHPARDLNARIDSMEGAGKVRTEIFHALREVGNVGSHGSGTRREVVLAAFEIYEDQLHKLFDPRGSRVETLAAKIRATKGK